MRWSAAIAAAVVAISLAARISLLLSRPLWHDERFTAWISRRPPGEIVAALRRDSGPPVFYLIERASKAASAPASRAWVLRLVSFAAALLLLPILLGSLPRRARAMGAVLVSCFALINLYAAEARAYALLALLGFLVFRMSQGGRESPARLAGLAVVAAIALYTHYLALFVVVAAAVAALAARRFLSAAACAAALAAFAPWLPILAAQPTAALAWLHEPPLATFEGFASALGGVGRIPLPFGASPPVALVGAAAVLGLLLTAGATAAVARRELEIRGALVFVLLVLGLAFAASVVRPLAFAGRSEMAALPVWVWALARASEESRALRRGAWAAAVLGMAATLFVVFSPHRKDTPAAAVRRLGGMTRSGDAVIAGPYFYLAARLAADRGDLPGSVQALPSGDADHPGWFVARLPGEEEEREISLRMDALPADRRLFLLLPPSHQTPGVMRTLFSRGTVREIVRQPDAVLLVWSASATPSSLSSSPTRRTNRMRSPPVTRHSVAITNDQIGL
ncbi:MAG TPA: hypothetical protein VH854_09095 [Thermoanaerobaculia bacterium]|nr:hypothetical protein [Thermoanaerobaculia bacterium]